MKLHDATRAPNPRRVRIFIAEKGLPMPELVQVDLAGLEQRQARFAALNPWASTPVLELDDGTAISESVAICRYFEELHPEPALFGSGPLGKAEVEMWSRRLDMGLYTHIAQCFRHTNPNMAGREVPQVPAWGEANRPKAIEHGAAERASGGWPPVCLRRPDFHRRHHRRGGTGFRADHQTGTRSGHGRADRLARQAGSPAKLERLSRTTRLVQRRISWCRQRDAPQDPL
jgi:glutathione S-transferase